MDGRGTLAVIVRKAVRVIWRMIITKQERGITARNECDADHSRAYFLASSVSSIHGEPEAASERRFIASNGFPVLHAHGVR